MHKSQNILLTYYRNYSEALAAGLLNDEYDIIFTWDSTNLALEKSIEHISYERSRMVAVLYASHPFARRESLTREDRLLVENFCRELSVNRNGNLAAHNFKHTGCDCKILLFHGTHLRAARAQKQGYRTGKQ